MRRLVGTLEKLRRRIGWSSGRGSAGRIALLGLVLLAVFTVMAVASNGHDDQSHRTSAAIDYPPPLESYGDADWTNLWEILANRVEKEPFNLVATLLFLCAIVHTFMCHRFRHIAHDFEERHEAKIIAGTTQRRVSARGRLFHFLGEVEAVFGIWILPMLVLMAVFFNRDTVVQYINDRVNFSEPVFVVVIMTVASTRPILDLTEKGLRLLARLGGDRPAAWWLVLLTVGPILGSFITEPAAMTICASLLARKFYDLKPGPVLSYGTLGLLFVAVSVGGTLTAFAAPPVLMVADAWGWNTGYMMANFGWKALMGIGIAAGAYFLFFHRGLLKLGGGAPVTEEDEDGGPSIPFWVTGGHLLFMVFAIANSHHPKELIIGMLFFLAFVEVTEDFQKDFSLRPPVLVGFFLAGLVIHGGLQQWWIAPVLGRLGELPLLLGATALTAFNDNAAITYLCTLVPTFSDSMKHAAVAGAVAGGGLTVIANAPNPAGQSILSRYFEDGVSALALMLGALLPTVIMVLCFILLR